MKQRPPLSSPETPAAWVAHGIDPLGSPKAGLFVRIKQRSEAWIAATMSTAWTHLVEWIMTFQWPEHQTVALAVLAIFCFVSMAAALFVIVYELTWGQPVNSGNGVTVFYNVLTCPPRNVLAGGRLNDTNVSFLFNVQYAQTDDDCDTMFGSLFPETVSEGPQFGAPSPPPLPPGGLVLDRAKVKDELGSIIDDRDHHLKIMIREDDGYVRGEAYVPVVLLGRNHYAFIQFSILDALRREVYREVTLQLGPDEKYPWSTNSTTKDRDDVDWAEEDWVEDVFQDLGEDLIENFIDRVEDVAEVVSEDILDSRQAKDNATAFAAEEAEEAAEEAAEEQAEAEAEEEEAEVEAAAELGLLADTKQKAFKYWRTVRRVALCAVDPSVTCDYFNPDAMSSTPSVPEAYYGKGGQEGGGAEIISPPFYYGASAVLKATPIVMATEAHYRVRTDYASSTAAERCKGIQCSNITFFRPGEDLDRYELVPAGALLTPHADVRWPLQLRIQSAAVYSRRSATPQPLLLSFNKLGFDPEYAAYSDREGAWHEYKDARGTPKLVIMLVVAGVVTLLCITCSRVSSALADVRGGESPTNLGGEDDDSDGDLSSTDPSPASQRGEPIEQADNDKDAGSPPELAGPGAARRPQQVVVPSPVRSPVRSPVLAPASGGSELEGWRVAARHQSGGKAQELL